jgi:hypothetical protein
MECGGDVADIGMDFVYAAALREWERRITEALNAAMTGTAAIIYDDTGIKLLQDAVRDTIDSGFPIPTTDDFVHWLQTGELAWQRK